MRHLVTALIFFAAAALAQAKEAGRPAPPPKHQPKSSVITPDKLLLPQGARDNARGKAVETIIPDICKGC